MKRHHEKKIEAYLDGATSFREGQRLERQIREDDAARRHLEMTQALGRGIKQAWSEGPPGPSPEYLIAALRPEMDRSDAERSRRPRWEGTTERLAALLRPVPIAAIAGAAALVLIVVTSLGVPQGDQGLDLGKTARIQEPPSAQPVAHSAAFDSPTTIYDLAQGDSPLMIFEADDGATVVWLLEEEGLSSLATPAGWA